MYKLLIRPILFLFAPEKAHYFVFKSIYYSFKIPFIKAIVNSIFCTKNRYFSKELLGLKFPNRVGLAAGFDKDALLFDQLGTLGFGFVEIGTLTPKAQEGNPKPRMFRLVKDKGLINRMGFNNQGVKNAVKRLQRKKTNIIIGGNIGKNKVTPNEKALEDYIHCFRALQEVVDYFVVNVSSPNTPNLRDLQEKGPLKKILSVLQNINTKKHPILLKIAPDLTNEQLDDIIKIVQETHIQGVIATNTTIDRSNLKTPVKKVQSIGRGGLSGKPVKDKSTQVIKYLYQKSKGSFTIIGVGGIHSPQDAIEKIKAGASLVQIYTGFIYEGPSLIKKINKAFIKENL